MFTLTELLYPIAAILGGLIIFGSLFLLGSLYLAKIRFEENVKILKEQVDRISIALKDHIKMEDAQGPVLYEIVESLEGLKTFLMKNISKKED